MACAHQSRRAFGFCTKDFSMATRWICSSPRDVSEFCVTNPSARREYAIDLFSCAYASADSKWIAFNLALPPSALGFIKVCVVSERCMGSCRVYNTI